MSVSDLSFLQPPCRLLMLWKTNAGDQAAYSGQLRGVSDAYIDGHPLAHCARRNRCHSMFRQTTASTRFPVGCSEDISGELQVEVTGKVRRLDRRKYPRVRVSMPATTAFLPGTTNRPPA